MKRYGQTVSDCEAVFDKTKEISFSRAQLPDEELRRLLRRAVENTIVPAKLETRLLGLLREKSVE